jgi:hypothetical protein
LDLDDRLGRGKLTGQALVLLTQADELAQGSPRGGAPPSLRRQRRERSLRAVAPPLGEMGGVEPFPAQERAELSRCRTPIRFRENPQLVGRSELSSMGALHNFRVGGNRSRSTRRRDGVDDTIRSAHNPASFPALYSNFRGFAVSLCLTTRSGVFVTLGAADGDVCGRIPGKSGHPEPLVSGVLPRAPFTPCSPSHWP